MKKLAGFLLLSMITLAGLSQKYITKNGQITFDATSSLQLTLGFSHREGEVFSYALPPRPDIVALAAESKPVGSFDRPPYTAYRVDGSTNAFSASAGYILSRNISVQVNYEFRHTSSGSLRYENHLVEARIVFAY